MKNTIKKVECSENNFALKFSLLYFIIVSMFLLFGSKVLFSAFQKYNIYINTLIEIVYFSISIFLSMLISILIISKNNGLCGSAYKTINFISILLIIIILLLLPYTLYKNYNSVYTQINNLQLFAIGHGAYDSDRESAPNYPVNNVKTKGELRKTIDDQEKIALFEYLVKPVILYNTILLIQLLTLNILVKRKITQENL